MRHMRAGHRADRLFPPVLTGLLASLVTGLVSPAARAQPEPTAPTPRPGEGGVVVHVDVQPQWSLYMLARQQATLDEPERVPTLANLARAAEQAAGSPRFWPMVDGSLLGEHDFHEPEWIESFPMERIAGSKAAEAREALDTFLRAWASGLGEYLHDGWREDQKRVAPRARSIQEELTDAADPLLRRALEALGLEPAGEIVIELVPVAPKPGAMTYRTGSGPVSVVGEHDLDDDTLLEVSLHEAIHGFDSLAQPDRDDVLALLRDALGEAGIDDRDPRSRNTWHALFFVHAAELVRRDGRPDYVDYGERSGVYAKTGPVVRVMRELWPQVLDGGVSRGEFVRRVVEAAR